ncbi:MAG: hypothetical protein Q8L64_03165, partial [bacterium]|nr:hypothetical protein [bacterium]
MPNKKSRRTTCLVLASLTLLACSVFTIPNPTPTPIQPTDTPAPIRIPGVDDPVSLDEQDMKLLVLGVDLEAGEQSGRLKLVLKYGPPFGLTDAEWIARNSELTCGATSYQPRSMGLYVGDAGKLEHFRLIFDVPENINFTECALRLPGTIE